MIPDSLSAIANHLWQSTVFACTAGLLTLALRKNAARVRFWVWVAASLKFLVPFSLLIALGSYVPWRTDTPPMQTNLTVTLDQVSEPFTISASSDVAVPPQRPSRLPEILWAIWVCGFVGIACSWWVRWRRISSAVRSGSQLQLGLPIGAVSSSSFLEPGVFGIFRPILLLPEGIFEHLTPEQWKTVVAHELCHVRHRDNLIGAVQMFVETIFWFHPLAWWIGNRIFEERERACDEEVLREGGEPRVYAQGILKICELYLESPVACVAGISGASLKRRMEGIMQNRVAQRLNGRRKLMIVTAGLLTVIIPIVVGLTNAPSIRAQSTRLLPSFEVASVKPSSSSEVTYVRAVPGRLTADASLQILLQYAYGIQPFQIIGGPGWIRSDRYQIDAKISGDSSRARAFLMLQSLIEDRFQFKYHRETRELPVYALTTARDGLRLPPAKRDDCVETAQDASWEWAGGRMATPGELPDAKPQCGVAALALGPRGAQLQGGKIATPELARALSLMMDRSVIDRTGFTGSFDLQVDFVPDETTRAMPPPPPDSGISGSSLRQALRRLGLQLESTRGAVEVLVIDHVERPSED